MLYNKGDRVVLRRDGRAGKVTRASDKRDEFAVQFDDDTELDELRGSELAPEHRIKGTPAPRDPPELLAVIKRRK